MRKTHPLETVLALNAMLGLSALSGCISIGTYERQMKACRDCEEKNQRYEESFSRLQLENKNLQQKVNESGLEEKNLKEKISEVRGTYDDLVERLKEDISKGTVDVERSGGDVKVTLGNNVLFKSGQAQLQKSGKDILGDVADVLNSVEDREIRVEGHTDIVPVSGSLKAKYGSNWELSSARAAAVVRFLEEQGVDAGQMAAVGYAEHHPVSDNSTTEGRRQNRRVEIYIANKPVKQPAKGQ